MAFRRKNFRRFGGRGRRGPSRSPRSMNNGWVAAIDSFLATSVLGGGGAFFTDIVFVPLIEVADYSLTESLDPDGTPTKQDRSRVLKMVGDLTFRVIPGLDAEVCLYRINWYLARFGKEESDNAVGNSLAGGLFNYDPLQLPGPFMYSQQAIVEQRQSIGFSTDPTTGNPNQPTRIGQHNYRWNRKMSLPLKSDDEFYLVFAMTSTEAFAEDPPLLAVDYMFRFLITD